MNTNIKKFTEEGEKMREEFHKKQQAEYWNISLGEEELIVNWWIDKFSSRQISLIKMIVESCEASKRIELLKLRSCENDKLNWNYHQGKVHQLEDLLLELIKE